jgi:hypothetical protein
MSRKMIVFVSAMLLLSLAVPAGRASSETTVSYHVATNDVFPTLTDINASVTLDCSAVFNSSDGTVLPNNSTQYLITAKPGSGTLTVNYTVNRPLLKKSGSPSVPINSTWLLGDSPPIPVYNDGTIKITVIIHGHLNGQVTAAGNGSATPSNVTWSTWKTINITATAKANAQNGQSIQIQTATKYVAYFTVTVELIGIQAFTQDSPTEEISGSPLVQSSILVIPEFSTWPLLLLTFLVLSMIIVLASRRFCIIRKRELLSKFAVRNACRDWWPSWSLESHYDFYNVRKKCYLTKMGVLKEDIEKI